MTDETFLAQFEACTLPPALFNHLGHMRLAWIQLRRLPFDEAVQRTCGGIRAYATYLGAAQKFHWTVTEAIMHLLRADAALEWHDFVARHCGDARARLAQHYSEERLAQGREHFVAPDLAPLPA